MGRAYPRRRTYNKIFTHKRIVLCNNINNYTDEYNVFGNCDIPHSSGHLRPLCRSKQRCGKLYEFCRGRQGGKFQDNYYHSIYRSLCRSGYEQRYDGYCQTRHYGAYALLLLRCYNPLPGGNGNGCGLAGYLQHYGIANLHHSLYGL